MIPDEDDQKPEETIEVPVGKNFDEAVADKAAAENPPEESDESDDGDDDGDDENDEDDD